MKNDRTGSGKAMEILPGPKTAIKKSKIPKNVENSKIRIFVFSRVQCYKASYNRAGRGKETICIYSIYTSVAALSGLREDLSVSPALLEATCATG